MTPIDLVAARAAPQLGSFANAICLDPHPRIGRAQPLPYVSTNVSTLALPPPAPSHARRSVPEARPSVSRMPKIRPVSMAAQPQRGNRKHGLIRTSPKFGIRNVRSPHARTAYRE
ncbi:hypothetical protein C8Q76DRAFT_729757 [Earliella scabrosa]|nr:hypothetical protein C8Q76DRAFT_729757 [Earliella scabrosa]